MCKLSYSKYLLNNILKCSNYTHTLVSDVVSEFRNLPPTVGKAIAHCPHVSSYNLPPKLMLSDRIWCYTTVSLVSLQAVQEVISNLMISHIELRTEQSPDIQPYTHERKVEKNVVPLGEELGAVKEKYLQVTIICVLVAVELSELE